MLRQSIRRTIEELFFRLPSSMILMFHHIGVDEKERISSCALSKEKFEAICRNYSGMVKGVDESLRKNNCISFTFDDGFTDLYSVAYPIMKMYQIPFTVFIIEEFIGKSGYMTLEQIKELVANPLVEIGSHGYSHKNLTELYEEEIVDEILGTKERLESLFQTKIDKFAYSHGQYNVACLSCVKSYDTAYAADSKPINFITRKRRYTYPRVNMTDSTFDDVIPYIDNLLRRADKQ